MSQEESPIQVTLGGVIDTLEHALELSQEQTPPEPATPEAPSAPAGPTTHHTAAGESWESIAAQYGVDVAALYEANAHIQPAGFGIEGLPVNKDIVIP